MTFDNVSRCPDNDFVYLHDTFLRFQDCQWNIVFGSLARIIDWKCEHFSSWWFFTGTLYLCCYPNRLIITLPIVYVLPPIRCFPLVGVGRHTVLFHNHDFHDIVTIDIWSKMFSSFPEWPTWRPLIPNWRRAPDWR